MTTNDGDLMQASGPTAKAVSRRRFAASLAVLTSAGLPAACALPGQDGPAAAPPPGGVSGRVVLWFLAQFRFDEDLGAELVREVQEKTPRLTVVPELITGDRVEKLKIAAAAGTAPDIGQAGYWQMQEMGAEGIAAPLDRYFNASRVVRPTDLWPTIYRDLSWKGKPYGVPFAPGVAVFYGQTSVLGAAGVSAASLPKTWSELEQNVQRVYRAATPDQPARLAFHPLRGQGDSAAWLIPFWQLGGEALSPDGTKVTINNARGIRALEWIQGLVRAQGGWDALNAQLDQRGVVGTFVNGRMGYMYETSDQPVRDDFKNAQGLQYTFASYPLPPGGKPVAMGGCHSFCITTQSKAPDGAWAFLEHFASESAVLRFAKRYLGIPVRVAVGRSTAFHQNDPLLKQAVEEMANFRFLLPPPGGTEMARIYRTMPDNVMAGKLSIRDALTETERQMQLVLDKWKR